MFFSVGVCQARGDWAWYQQIFGFPSWSGKMIGWMCAATSDDSMPYWDFSMTAKWRAKRHKLGTFFQAQRLAGSTVGPLLIALGPPLDMVCIGIMHCVDFGVHPRGVGQHLQ